jgi:ferredoxin-NADP reductase
MIPIISADVLDFWLQRLNPALSVSRTLARLVARTVVAHDTIQLTFAPNRAFRGARPGQHVNLTAEVDGRQVTRCYSVTSLPQRGRRFDLVVKRLAHGRMSSFLTQRLRIGEAVQIGQAFGEMQAEPADATPRLLLAGGVGITPLLAQIRESAGAGFAAPTTLLYWAKRRADLCFAAELEALQRQFPNFSVRFLLTQAEQPQPRISEGLIREQLPDLASRSVFACGPGGFVREAGLAVASQALRFQSESFEPLRAAAEEGGEVIVRLLKQGIELPVKRGRTLLEALEGQGVALRSGCRMGICNTCACPSLSGLTRDLRSQAISSGEPASVRLCVSAAVTDLTLDL